MLSGWRPRCCSGHSARRPGQSDAGAATESWRCTDLQAAEALALGKSKKPVQDVKPVQALLRKLEYEMEAKGMPVPKDAGFVA